MGLVPSPAHAFARTADPLHVAFDATEKHLFVADAIANQIDEYDYATGTLVNAIAFPRAQLDGVAISPKAPPTFGPPLH